MEFLLVMEEKLIDKCLLAKRCGIPLKCTHCMKEFDRGVKDAFRLIDFHVQDVVFASILVRPYPTRVLELPITHTAEKSGKVPAVYIKYLRDNTMPAAAQDWIAENLGPFKEVVETDGGHFHFHVEIDDFTQLVYRLTANYFNS